jgi:alpha-L-fucosidase
MKLTRRDLFKASAALAGSSMLDLNTLPTPIPSQYAWQEAELGVVFHYDLHVFDDKHYSQPYNRVNPSDITKFNPTELDTDQWVRTAKEMGARFAILTASHETGFRLWKSDANPYSLSSVEWSGGERDILAEFHASCLKYGLLPGVYVGIRWNSQLGIYDFKTTSRSTITQAEYNRMVEAEVEEICTRYGDWFEIWFDGGAYGPELGGPDVLSIVEKHQPNILFYHNHDRADARWGGSESGTVPYPCWATFPFPVTGAGESARREISANNFALLKSGVPDGDYYVPAMSDAPLRSKGGHEWFWDKGDDHLVADPNHLIDIYFRSVGHNSTLIMGLTPDDRGLMPDADVKRCREWGAAIERAFSKPLGSASSWGNTAAVEFGSQKEISLVVLQEEILAGERVRQHTVEVRSGGRWHKVADGSCIGHKRIIRLDGVVGDAVRLNILECRGIPRIRTLAAYGPA